MKNPGRVIIKINDYALIFSDKHSVGLLGKMRMSCHETNSSNTFCHKRFRFSHLKELNFHITEIMVIGE